MAKVDKFTLARCVKFVSDFRESQGVLATLKDLKEAGFEENVVNEALKQKIIGQFYVTLTNGTIVKTFKKR